jgi:hypothetical protein
MSVPLKLHFQPCSYSFAFQDPTKQKWKACLGPIKLHSITYRKSFNTVTVKYNITTNQLQNFQVYEILITLKDMGVTNSFNYKIQF